MFHNRGIKSAYNTKNNSNHEYNPNERIRKEEDIIWQKKLINYISYYLKLTL